MELSFVTAGESHGPGLTVVMSGVPAGLELDREAIRRDLARRQAGYGRSPRQKLEQDDARVSAGVRHGRTLGSPIALFIENRDHVLRSRIELTQARNQLVNNDLVYRRVAKGPGAVFCSQPRRAGSG